MSGIAEATTALRSLPECAGLRWTEPEKLHFTLRFLGSVPASVIPRVREVAAEVTAPRTAFTLAIAGGGAFPSPRRASVLWASAREGAIELSELAGMLNAKLDALGFEREERAFTPHLTLARSKRPAQLTAAVTALASLRVETRVSELLVVQSHLGRPSARYEVLARALLGT